MKLSSLVQENEKYLASIFSQEKIHIQFGVDKTVVFSSDKPHVYVPTPTGKLFHADDNFVRLVIGPYGSGKSTLCVHEIVRRACEMPYWINGRRRSKWAIVRNTAAELQSTTLQTWLMWFAELGDYTKREKPLMTYEFLFNDGKGIVELSLIFIALDREQDVRKIKSLELTGVYINELSETPSAVLSHFKGRVGRYPSKAMCDESYWAGIICDTNPPEDDHWIFDTFEVNKPENYKLFKQPPGLIKNEENEYERNLKADNVNHLPRDYYLRLAEGQSEEFIKVYCLGEYGTVSDARLVFSEFNDELHTKDFIPAIQGLPIHLGWDGGLTPSCVVIQFTPMGEFCALKEYTSERCGIRSFAENIVIPSLRKDFPYSPLDLSRADPSGVAKNEIFEELSFIGELNSLHLPTEAAKTNRIEPRLNAVRFFLNRMVDGRPKFKLCKRGCPILRKGFLKGYYFKRVAVAGEARYRSEPDKNECSHPHDALQYIALEFAADALIDKKKRVSSESMFNPVMNIF